MASPATPSAVAKTRGAGRCDHEQPGHGAPGTEPIQQHPGRDLHDAEREEETRR